MEVHHHSHTERKKWTHYFWEFFMLFAAVFCGFLAENWREHVIEHKREKEYMQTLIQDLELDTAGVQQALEINRVKLNFYDSLRKQLKELDQHQDLRQVYYFFQSTTYYFTYTSTKGTIHQLENAGGLRLIRNKKARDSIAKYYDIVTGFEDQSATFQRYFDQYHEVAFQVFDYSQFEATFYTPEKILSGSTKYTLLTYDPTTIKVLSNKLFALKLILGNYKLFFDSMREMAINVIAFLKKEYHLK